MDWELEFFTKFSRHRNWQWRSGGNANAQLRYPRYTPHLRERLKKNRRAGENCRAAARKIDKQGTRRPVSAQNQRDTARYQRCEQIAESIGVRNRYRAEVKIDIFDSHRLADLIAIGQQLLAPKPNRACRFGC